MSASRNYSECGKMDSVRAYALGALAADEMRVVEAHLAACAECTREVEVLRPVVASFFDWPTDVLRPSSSLWDRLAERIGADKGASPQRERWPEPEPVWEEVASGIHCKLFATDPDKGRVTMLVRLAPGTAYPPHRHAGEEVLHLLHGELWIDDRKLHAGDFYRSEAGTSDQRVWSETGCTCVLITSPEDVLLKANSAV